jgi:hypothetical protein
MPGSRSEFAGVFLSPLGNSRPSEALFSDPPQRPVGLSPRLPASARFSFADLGISRGPHHPIAVALSHSVRLRPKIWILLKHPDARDFDRNFLEIYPNLIGRF